MLGLAQHRSHRTFGKLGACKPRRASNPQPLSHRPPSAIRPTLQLGSYSVCEMLGTNRQRYADMDVFPPDVIEQVGRFRWFVLRPAEARDELSERLDQERRRP